MCCAAFFFLAGGHWAVLQSVAWANMLADYAKADTLSVAVAKTFDGKHPCDMCQSISNSKKTEEKPATLKSDKKIESLAGASQVVLQGSLPFSVWICRDVLMGAGRTDAPPVPPPRLLGA